MTEMVSDYCPTCLISYDAKPVHLENADSVCYTCRRYYFADAPSYYLTDETLDEMGAAMDAENAASSLPYMTAVPMQAEAMFMLAAHAALYARGMAAKYPNDEWATNVQVKNVEYMTTLGFPASDIADIMDIAK